MLKRFITNLLNILKGGHTVESSQKGYIAHQQKNGQELDTLKAELTNLALRIAKEGYGIKLNFKHTSIKHVENILSIIHNEYVKTGDRSGMNGIALEFGAYIITTIERNTEKGLWERNHPEFGEETFPFHWRGATIFPYEWCKSEFMMGKEIMFGQNMKSLSSRKFNEAPHAFC